MQNEKPKIYISGPITGRPVEEYTAEFKAAADDMSARGYEPINPVALCAHLPNNSTWEQYMAVCIDALKDAKAIYLLPNWEKSAGAKVEARHACEMGIYFLHAPGVKVIYPAYVAEIEKERRELLDTYPDFQKRVAQWMGIAFSESVVNDKRERAMRFFEEAAELCQSIGLMREEAQTLVNYVFNRPTGDTIQEVGGVMVTLSALCNTVNISHELAGEVELERINRPSVLKKIQSKQVTKGLFGITATPKQ